MKYEDKPRPDNFKRFEQLTRQILSVSNSDIKQKLADEKRKKKEKNEKPKR